MRRAPVVVAVLIAAAVFGSGVRTLAPAIAQVDTGTRPVELLAGWNLVAWTGAETPVEEALGEAISSIDSVHTFDGGRQAFDTFTTGGPSFLNSLAAIASGAGVWLFANADVTWEQPRITGPRTVDLVAGFNLVGWTGPRTAVAEALAEIAAGLDSLFMWDAPAEEFLTYGPARPAFLNRVEALSYGDGFWLLMTAAGAWAQPGLGPVTVELPGINGRLEIPAGALPPGVSPGDLRITDTGGVSEFLVPESDPADLVLRLEPSGLEFDPPLTLEIEVDVPAGSLVSVVLVTDGDVEFVEGVSLDVTTGSTVLRIPIAHFTELIANWSDAVSVDSAALGKVPLGSFVPNARVRRLGDVRLEDEYHVEGCRSCPYTEPGLVVRSRQSLPPWTVHISVRSAEGPITPIARTAVQGSETALLLDVALIASDGAMFSCDTAGEFSFAVVAFARLDTRVRSVFIPDGGGPALRGDEFQGTLIGWARAEFTGECVDPSQATLRLVTSGQPTQNELHVVLADEDEFDEDDGDFRLAQAAGASASGRCCRATSW